MTVARLRKAQGFLSMVSFLLLVPPARYYYYWSTTTGGLLLLLLVVEIFYHHQVPGTGTLVIVRYFPARRKVISGWCAQVLVPDTRYVGCNAVHENYCIIINSNSFQQAP